MRPLTFAPGRLWMLPLLLLAAALSGSLLDFMAFDADEAATLLRIGGQPADAYSLAGILQAVYDASPDQALGWPLLVAIWARLVGWSEVALRSLSWFGGLLAIALLWRAGRDMYGPAVGLVAAGLMATSVLFVTYMAIARAFTLVVLFSVLTLYAYWRMALRPRPPGLADRATLLAGAAGLLYTHYFGALLLPALGLFHLLCARRDRRWLQTLSVFLLAGLAFLPALGSLLRGVEFNLGKPGLSQAAMAPHVAVAHIIEVYSNGLVSLLPKVAALLFALAAAFVLHSAWQRRHARRRPDALWLPAFVTITLFALILLANEFVNVLLSGRVRYAFALWPLFSLLLAAGYRYFRRPGFSAVPLYHLLLALLLVTGLVGNIRSSLRVRYVYHLPPPPLHRAMRDLEAGWNSRDLLLVDPAVTSIGRVYRVYTDHLGESRLVLPKGPCDAACLATTGAQLRQHANVWLLFANPSGDLQTRLQQALPSLGLFHCRTFEYDHLRPLELVQHTRGEADCS